MKLMHTFIIVNKKHILFVSKLHVDLIKKQTNQVLEIDI